LSKALEIFTLDLAFKSELKSKEQCRIRVEAKDTVKAIKTWEKFDVFQLR